MRYDLDQMQSLPLEAKIKMTERRIQEWYEYFSGDIYVSFSGGKDSTVLLDIVRNLYPDVEAVFVDTGLEYPEIREFVKKFENVTWLKPKITFKQVIEKCGYPFISKEVSECVYQAKKNAKTGKYSYRIARLNGELKDKEGNYSQFNIPKYKFLLDCPVEIGQGCCEVMKKSPTREFGKKTGKKPMTAQMADESKLRLQQWIKSGCNAFDNKKQISNPMSFWTEQDVLSYIKNKRMEISSVYGRVCYVDSDGYEYEDTTVENMINMLGKEIANSFVNSNLKLKTTGCTRTGCMFCGYGCHLEKEGEGRFELMRKTHPKQYDYIMKPKDQGGLDYKNIIDWINEHGNLNIRY